jgi:hypothetical protein
MVDTLDTLTDAAIGVATAKVAGFLSGLIPGFGDHFDRADRERRSEGSGLFDK